MAAFKGANFARLTANTGLLPSKTETWFNYCAGFTIKV